MGTFAGHILPGSFFLLASVWWTINIFRYFFKSKCKNGPPYVARPWFPGPFCREFPFESYVKLVTVTIGMLGELATAFENGVFEHIVNAQHMTMYFFFGINGAMDLLKHYNFHLPNGIEAATGILAYSVEGFLFYNHLHGRSHMDIQVHMFLFYTIAMCVFSVFLEVWHPDWVMGSLSRAFFTQMQGTWFCQVGFILYPPFPGMQRWDQDNHEQMMIITMIYTWHCAINLVFMLCVGAGVFIWMKSWRQLNEVNYRQLSTSADTANAILMSPGKMMTNMNGGSMNGHLKSQIQLMDSDSEEV